MHIHVVDETVDGYNTAVILNNQHNEMKQILTLHYIKKQQALQSQFVLWKVLAIWGIHMQEIRLHPISLRYSHMRNFAASGYFLPHN